MKWIIQITIAACALTCITMAAVQKFDTAAAGWIVAALVFVICGMVSAKEFE